MSDARRCHIISIIGIFLDIFIMARYTRFLANSIGPGLHFHFFHLGLSPQKARQIAVIVTPVNEMLFVISPRLHRHRAANDFPILRRREFPA